MLNAVQGCARMLSVFRRDLGCRSIFHHRSLILNCEQVGDLDLSTHDTQLPLFPEIINYDEIRADRKKSTFGLKILVVQLEFGHNLTIQRDNLEFRSIFHHRSTIFKLRTRRGPPGLSPCEI